MILGNINVGVDIKIGVGSVVFDDIFEGFIVVGIFVKVINCGVL